MKEIRFKKKQLQISESHWVEYFESGVGKTVVILPSLWLTSRSYFQISELLAKYYRVLLVDLYRGQSVFKKNASSILDYAESLDQFMQLVNEKNYYLLSFSLSGIYSTYLTQHLKQIPKKLLLISSTAVPFQVRNRVFYFCAAMMKLLIANFKSLQGIRIVMQYCLEAGIFLIYHPLQFFAEVYAAITDHQLQNYSDMKVATKVIIGNQDEFIPAEAIDHMRKITGLEVEVLSAKHDWFFYQPDLLVSKVKEYFG